VPVEVHVVTPEREIWAGEAEMVIARGTEGEVGILQGHIPLLVRLAIGLLRIHRAGGEQVDVVVDGGFLHVTSEGSATRVDVLADLAELGAEVDAAAAAARKQEAEARLAQDRGDRVAQTELAKADARLAVGA
jgi:F-type H+-transporting ATPase subunit epsilon